MKYNEAYNQGLKAGRVIRQNEVKALTDECDRLKKSVKYLQERDDTLTALENGGVDNWEWYGESLDQAGLL